MGRLACDSNCGNRFYYNLFATEGVNAQNTNLLRAKEDFSMVKDENLHSGENEQREYVEQPIRHIHITEEIVIPPGGKTFIVIICTAV